MSFPHNHNWMLKNSGFYGFNTHLWENGKGETIQLWVSDSGDGLDVLWVLQSTVDSSINNQSGSLEDLLSKFDYMTRFR